MKVLLTGALGSLGSLVLESLLRQGHQVWAFDVKNKTNLSIAKQFNGVPDFNLCWGDIRDSAQVEQLVAKVDAIIHLAAIIVPQSEANPELARQVNVGGTDNLVGAVNQMEQKPLFLYCSSFAVFGPQSGPPPRVVEEQPIATDHYTQHKIESERMVSSLESPWAILRLGGMADARMRHRGLDQAKYALAIAADTRFEYVHPKDAATAFVNCLTNESAHRKIHLIGGGPECQVTHKDVLDSTLGAMGIMLKKSDFGSAPLYADWADTSESQRLLNFQNHSFEDFRSETFSAFRRVRPFLKPLSPLARRALMLMVRA